MITESRLTRAVKRFVNIEQDKVNIILIISKKQR